MRERWHLLQQLFDETADLDPVERAERLQRRFGQDELIQDVEELVRADRAAHATVDPFGEPGALGAELAQAVSGADEDALIGTTVGPYRIEARVSSGGMGSVFRAAWARDGIERRVAIKVLKRGLDTDALLARFRREQRSLAALEHENVVTFIDSGALADGRPYLVMEYVDGGPLTTWCDERGLAIRERLELFLEVLAGVRHAHQRLIVHRDLKPSNVLVGPGGVPKLLDFGVAALLDDDASARATRAGSVAPLTPGYASPEQLRGEPPSTANDVYSLGAILYELLAGRPAHAGPLPLGADLPPPSERATTPSTARALRGDLDRIVLQALHPDAGRRYPSVERLADDVANHLAGRPVSARRATPAYRAARFVSRNRWRVAAGVALLLVLVAGLAGAELGRRRAVADASRGWGAHVEAKLASSWLGDVLAETTHAGSGWLAVADARAAEVATEFAGHTEAEALARLGLARLFVTHGMLERAEPELRRVRELARTPGSGVGAAEERRVRELEQQGSAARGR